MQIAKIIIGNFNTVGLLLSIFGEPNPNVLTRAYDPFHGTTIGVYGFQTLTLDWIALSPNISSNLRPYQRLINVAIFHGQRSSVSFQR